MIHIDKELCKGCKICVKLCPKEVLALSSHTNKKGYNYIEAVHPENCVACKSCERGCPDFVFYIEA